MSNILKQVLAREIAYVGLTLRGLAREQGILPLEDRAALAFTMIGMIAESQNGSVSGAQIVWAAQQWALDDDEVDNIVDAVFHAISG
jgi:hypothetical protein